MRKALLLLLALGGVAWAGDDLVPDGHGGFTVQHRGAYEGHINSDGSYQGLREGYRRNYGERDQGHQGTQYFGGDVDDEGNPR
jgi:hypothetical protein